MAEETGLQRLNGWGRAADRVLCIAAAVIILFMMLLTTLDVVLRYAFNNPLTGVYELQEFMLVGVVFLALAYIQSSNGHIYVDLLTNRFSEKGQTVLRVFSHVVSLLIFGLITWQGGLRAWMALVTGQSREGLISYPLWPAKWILTIGVGFFCLRIALDIALDFQKLRSPHSGSTGKRS